MNLNKKQIYHLLSTGTNVLTTVLIRKALEVSWKKLYSTDPPENPAEKYTPFKDAMLWAIASGLTVSLGKLATSYIMAKQWENIEGEKPPRD